MKGKRLRSSLFGFKKSDVLMYISELDEKAELKLADKDKEINELRIKNDELEKKRDAVINVLKIADKRATDMVEEAQTEANGIRERAEVEIKQKKELVNREIEIKRKAIKTYYANENKKIEQIREDVERMREASLEAIRKFESELRQVQRMTDNSRSYVSSAMDYADTSIKHEEFQDVGRVISVQIVNPVEE